MRVPIRYSGEGPGGENLGAWASNIRQRGRNGTSQNRLSGVPQEKQDRLAELGFLWEVCCSLCVGCVCSCRASIASSLRPSHSLHIHCVRARCAWYMRIYGPLPECYDHC